MKKHDKKVYTLTPEEEREMDLFSNAAIDLTLAHPEKYLNLDWLKKHTRNKSFKTKR